MAKYDKAQLGEKLAGVTKKKKKKKEMKMHRKEQIKSSRDGDEICFGGSFASFLKAATKTDYRLLITSDWLMRFSDKIKAAAVAPHITHSCARL